MNKIILIALISLTMAACANTQYPVQLEANVDEGRTLNQIPQWYVDATIDKGLITNRNADEYIYAVGQGTSPNLQLAVEKAVMVAKANLADQLEGEMNKRTELYVTEVGQEGSKEVASKIESTIVNVIQKIKVQGYEEWNKDVYETPNGEYRVYIGLKMGVGDANRLAEYIAKNAHTAVDVDTLAKHAIDKVMVEDLSNPDGIPTIE